MKFTSEFVWLFNCNTNTAYRRAVVITVYYTFGCQIKLRFRLHIIVQTHKYTLGKKKWYGIQTYEDELSYYFWRFAYCSKKPLELLNLKANLIKRTWFLFVLFFFSNEYILIILEIYLNSYLERFYLRWKHCVYLIRFINKIKIWCVSARVSSLSGHIQFSLSLRYIQ